MIQFKRGTTDSWRKQKTPLAAGQPGYDKDTKKIKIGDGKSAWDELPYASGLFADEIIDSEENAQRKAKEADAKIKKLLSSLGVFGTALSKMIKKDDGPIITYGTSTPNNETIGQVYLQSYDTEPEADYVIEIGIDDFWTYRKWKSGLAECWGTYTQEESNTKEVITITSKTYPFVFSSPPTEMVFVTGDKPIVTQIDKNTVNGTGKYSLTSQTVSMEGSVENVIYYVNFDVKGRWKRTT